MNLYRAMFQRPVRRPGPGLTMIRFRGFTMLEVMFAIMILGVGLIAVASLFPLATAVQRDTVDLVRSHQVAASAEAQLNMRRISESVLSGVGNDVTKIDDAQLNTEWPEGDRTFPQSIPLDDIDQRRYIWKMLARIDGDNRYHLYIFVMRRIAGQEPDVVNAGKINIGDAFVKDDGTVDIDTDGGNNGNWHAEVINGRSSFVQLIVLGDGAVRK